MNKNCNRCGRFRSTKHVCNPVKVIINGKVAYSFTLGKKKSPKSLKQPIKHTGRRSRLGEGMIVGIASLSISVWSFTALANSAPTTQIISVATSTPLMVETPSISTTAPVVVAPERLHDKITRYAIKYGIYRESFHDLIQCEVGEMFNPNIRSQGILKSGKQENSWGLAQINLDVHAVTRAQATDPDFALDWLGQHWEQRHQMYVNCTKKLDIWTYTSHQKQMNGQLHKTILTK